MVSESPDYEHFRRIGNGLRLVLTLDNVALEYLLFFFVQVHFQGGKLCF